MHKSFTYLDNHLTIENVPLRTIAERFGTPTYVYSQTAITQALKEFQEAIGKRKNVLICYALKANPNLAIINLLARHGTGFDIVSGGELKRVQAGRGETQKTVFSGVGKSTVEIQEAIAAEILCFNVESLSELKRINELAGLVGKKAPVSLRVNPDVDPKTHPYIATGLKENKFGIPYDQALAAYRYANTLPHLELLGIACHIGSQITETQPFLSALEKLLELVDILHNEHILLKQIDLGGGLGISYKENDNPPQRGQFLKTILEKIKQHPRHQNYKILFEFGRTLVGESGGLLTRVEYIKENGTRNFAVVDAAMNDLMRPTLYQAWHPVWQVEKTIHATKNQTVNTENTQKVYDLVGPICESSDVLATQRPLSIKEGDFLLIGAAGAYGMSMASNYNTRGRAAEILVDQASIHLIRARESQESLIRLDILPSIP